MASTAIVVRTEQQTRDLIAAHRAVLRESLAAALVEKREARASLAAAREAARAAGETPSRSSVRPRRAPQSTGVTVATASNPPVAPKLRAPKRRAPKSRAPSNAGYMPFAVHWTDEQSVALAVAVVDNVHSRTEFGRNGRAAKGAVFWNAIYRAIYAGKFPALKSRVPQSAPKCMSNSRHLRKRAVRIGLVDDEFRPSVKARRVAAAAKATGVSRDAAWAAAARLLA
jgi:hypothetical protein